MTVKIAALIIVTGLLYATAPADAHHSFSAQYDASKPVTLRGTINRMLWSNPHGHLYIDVKTPDGKLVTWELETAAPAACIGADGEKRTCRWARRWSSGRFSPATERRTPTPRR